MWRSKWSSVHQQQHSLTMAGNLDKLRVASVYQLLLKDCLIRLCSRERECLLSAAVQGQLTIFLRATGLNAEME